MKENITTDKVIEQAILLFQTHGFNNTSMRDIAEKLAIKKSSLYHHIESREDLLLKVAHFIDYDFEENVLCVIKQSNQTSSTKLKLLSRALNSFYKKNNYQCLVCKLVFELSHNSAKFSEFAKNFFSKWVKAIETILLSEYDRKNAKIAALDFVSRLQGALAINHLIGGKNLVERVLQELATFCD